MQKRYLSLDIFRGATVVLMILVNNPGSFSNIFWPLDHAEWNGCTLTDLVFPFFLFAVGNSASFVLPKLKEADFLTYFKKVFKRSIYIFLIGLFLNWAPFYKWDNDSLIFKIWDNIRILGVLQRIAICYLAATLFIYLFNTKNLIFFSVFLLLFYWFLCSYFGGENPYGQHGYFGTYIDTLILGENHMYKGEGFPFEPEGLVSSMAAIVQIIIGYLIGLLIIKKGKSYEMLSELFIVGTLLVLIGLTWNLAFPINKKMWTSSYTILTSGIAILISCCFIYFIEFKKNNRYFIVFFEVFGKNPLFIFFLSGLIPRILGLIRITSHDKTGKLNYITPLRWIYENIFENVSNDLRIGSLLYALFFISIFWAIGYFLYKRKIFIKV